MANQAAKRSKNSRKRKSSNSSSMFTSASLNTNGRKHSRILMKEWLMQKADSKSIPGLQWYDRSRNLIRLSWIHGSRHSWDIEKDAKLFQAWAEHSGRYDPVNSNPKRWKANFRCAMNSLPDVNEVPELRKKGQHAYKVYRIEDSKVKKKKPGGQSEIAHKKPEDKMQASISEEVIGEDDGEADIQHESISSMLTCDQTNDSVLTSNESEKLVGESQNSIFSFKIDNEMGSEGESSNISTEPLTYDQISDATEHFTDSDYNEVIKQLRDNPESVKILLQCCTENIFGITSNAVTLSMKEIDISP